MWAGLPGDMKRTNNGTESFHAHFNEQFYSAYPTIFIFLDTLKKSTGSNIREISTLEYVKRVGYRFGANTDMWHSKRMLKM